MSDWISTCKLQPKLLRWKDEGRAFTHSHWVWLIHGSLQLIRRCEPIMFGAISWITGGEMVFPVTQGYFMKSLGPR